MQTSNSTLLNEIEVFLTTSGMGESYFGKESVGNSELVSRLRKNGRVWPETAAKVRDFIRAEKHAAGHLNVDATPTIQPPATKRKRRGRV